MQKPDTSETPAPLQAVAGPAPAAGGNSVEWRGRLKSLAMWAAGLSVCFALPLYDLLRFSLHSDLYSHICLVPFISGYIVWLRRNERASDLQPARGAAVLLALIGVAVLAGYWIARTAGHELERQERLFLCTLAFVLLFAAGFAWLAGRRNLRLFSFPLAFLLFMVPLPIAVEESIEALLQHASADASYALLTLSGMPVLRLDTKFILPGFSFEVAPECSGIHSTLVLFMTALLAGHFFFRLAWTRITLAAGILALGVVRNAVRIFTLAQLCVRVDPKFIDSPLHHRGGPLFFAASLIPFILLILVLRKFELRAKK